MSTTLYGVAGSPNVRGAMLALTEKGVIYDLTTVPPPFNDAAHLARNPFGRVPALEHEGFVVYETQAILRYVNDAFAGPALQPTAIRELARMNQILGIVDCYLFKSWSGDIGFERLVAPIYFGRPSDLRTIEAALPMAHKCAEALEGMISAPYLTGATYSLADIRLLPHLAWIQLTPEGDEILAGKPKLMRWFDRVRERSAVTNVLNDPRALAPQNLS